jgi:hypothetical protein
LALSITLKISIDEFQLAKRNWKHGLFTDFLYCTAISFSPAGELLSLLVQRRVTKETHPGALALRASLAERALLQGRFDARPCFSKLKCTSMYISPWQTPLCEATLMGTQNQKKLQKHKLIGSYQDNVFAFAC